MPTAVNRDQSQTVAFKSRPHASRHFSMLIALTLLLTTLLVVVVSSDREFWLASIQSAWSEIIGPDVPRTTAQSAAPAASPRTHLKQHKQAAAQPAPEPQTTTLPSTHRIVLAPLEVEVIAHGNQGQAIRSHDSAINLDLRNNKLVPQPETRTTAEPDTDVTNASEQFRISPATAELVSNPVGPAYPLLARRMKVQGSVVLQARIGQDGAIQDLQVMRGPEILSSAAVEAVKQWRFKPHLEAGRPVETDARITVYFTISTR